VSSASERPAELDRLAEEFIDRERCGDCPTISEYTRRHPELADDIRKVFPMLSILEGVKPAEGESKPAIKELGDYTLLREIGRGGMGVVYEAEQRALGRRVALKILPPHATLDARFLQRFRQEAQSAARLQHSNIVPVIGLSEHDDVHFYTMQFIDGIGLDHVLESVAEFESGAGPSSAVATRLFTGEVGTTSSTGSGLEEESSSTARGGGRPARRYYDNIARIGLQAAEALAHAHANGVIHRDVKPSNLMLDADGKIWITDFGLCKDEGSGALTQTGDLIGTLRYMPPERLDGTTDVRGDVYGLGITLYELLTRTPAFSERRRAPLMKQLAEVSPKRPRAVDARIPPDLEAIVQKAMSRDPELRYPTADAFAADLRAYLEGRPISARAPGLGYVMRVAFRRHRSLAVTSIAAVLVLAATSVFYVLSLTKKESQARFRHYVANIAATETALRDGDVHWARKLLDQAPVEHRNWEWSHFRSRLDESIRDFPSPATVVTSVAHHPDGTYLAAAADEEVWIYDDRGVEPVRKLAAGAHTFEVCWSPDGSLVATGTERALIVWSWPACEELHRIEQSDAVRALDFSADSTRVVTGCDDYNIRIFGAQTGDELARIPARSRAFGVAFHPEKNRVLSGCWDGCVTLWDVPSLERVWSRRVTHRSVHAVEFIDSRRVAASGLSSTILVLDAEDGGVLQRMAQSAGARRLAVSADHTLLASVDGVVLSLWDPATGRRSSQVGGHGRTVTAASFHPAGTRVVTASAAGTLKEWHVSGRGDPSFLLGHMDDVHAVAFGPAGRHVVSGGVGGILRQWDVVTGELMRTFIGHEGSVWDVELSPDGTRIAASDRAGDVRIWNAASGEVERRLVGRDGGVASIAYTADGARIVTGAASGAACIWTVADGSLLARVDASGDPLKCVAVSPDGRWMATAGSDRVLRVWDMRTYELAHEMHGHTETITDVAFHPRGELLATVSEDQSLRLWDAARGAEVRRLTERNPVLGSQTEALMAVAFTPDGSRIATGAREGSVKLWDTESGVLVSTLRGHTGWVHDVVFSADGRRLASSSGGAEIRVWDTVSLRDRAEELQAAATHREAAVPIVERLLAEVGDIDAVIQRIPDEELEPAILEAALRVAHQHRGSREALYRRLWSDLSPKSGSEPRQRVALAIAAGLARASGHRNEQDNRSYTVAGLASYRSARYDAALYYLERSLALNGETPGPLLAADLALLTTTYAALGRAKESAAMLARLRALIDGHPEVGDAASLRFLAEAEEAAAAGR